MEEIDSLYDNLPEEERIISTILRELIRETIPDCREKISWGAPFYYGRKSICFVWPASIPWGRLTSGVALGFTRGRELDHEGFLQFGDRKIIGRHIFISPEEIDVEQIVRLLQSASALDKK
ncbi:DUF1801 domain-containing protein [Neolewinella agarilytica]|uniref:DUF1801 domain-containing protein n=1 Tax=Neolewinella agarilytica TaxID=478744 RepID=UPI002356D8F3|nr:DUF1801 domain-containing protein [Neolewinella agarilytica]